MSALLARTLGLARCDASLIQQGSGSHFDPNVVEAFLSLLSEESNLFERESFGPVSSA